MNSDDYRVVFSSFFAKNLKYFLGFSFKIPLLYLWSPLLLNSSNVQKHGQELKKRLVQLVLNLPYSRLELILALRVEGRSLPKPKNRVL